jgi:hypothetical protein
VLRDLDYNNPLNNNGGCLGQVLWLAVAVAVCFLMGGCKTKYVAVPEYHNVYVEKHDTLIARDSIYEKDSIYIVKNGDTVTAYRDRIYYRDRWRDKIVYRDSIKTDSVRVAYPVVTNKVGWKDKIAYIGIGLIISFFIWIFCKIRLS